MLLALWNEEADAPLDAARRRRRPRGDGRGGRRPGGARGDRVRDRARPLLGVDSFVVPAEDGADGGGRPLKSVRVVFEGRVVAGELANEIDGTTDEARWFPLGDVAGLPACRSWTRPSRSGASRDNDARGRRRHRDRRGRRPHGSEASRGGRRTRRSRRARRWVDPPPCLRARRIPRARLVAGLHVVRRRAVRARRRRALEPAARPRVPRRAPRTAAVPPRGADRAAAEGRRRVLLAGARGHRPRPRLPRARGRRSHRVAVPRARRRSTRTRPAPSPCPRGFRRGSSGSR